MLPGTLPLVHAAIFGLHLLFLFQAHRCHRASMYLTPLLSPTSTSQGYSWTWEFSQSIMPHTSAGDIKKRAPTRIIIKHVHVCPTSPGGTIPKAKLEPAVHQNATRLGGKDCDDSVKNEGLLPTLLPLQALYPRVQCSWIQSLLSRV